MKPSKHIRRLIRYGLISTSLMFAVSSVYAETPQSTEQEPPAVQGVEQSPALTPEFIYKYLVGEVAGQRGDLGLASTLFLDLANSSRDSRLAERAAKAAIFGNHPSVAIPAVELWSKLDPESVDAQQTTVQMLISTGRVVESQPYLEKLLLKEDTRANGFLFLHSLFSRSPEKLMILGIVQDLARPYPDLPEAHFAAAQAAAEAKQLDLALSELAEAEKLRPGWEAAALLQGLILFVQAPKSAIVFYRDFLKKYPDANETRLAFARLLVNQKQFDQAKSEFIQLTSKADANPEIYVVVGLLSYQSGAYDDAEKYFQQALTTDYRDMDQVYLYLGHNAEKQEKYPEAMEWYSKVQPGQRFLDAKLNIAYVLAKTEGPEAGINMLQKLDGMHSEQQALVNQSIAGLLNQAKRHQEAYDLLEKTVNSLPNTPDIIYDFAMTAERLQKLDVMESELRKLIKIKPDFAAAYNALGYSLADRNVNLQEAHSLIEKALMLSPDDHYIMDSMGWVHYRMGSLELALNYLQRAYEVQSDPEIAAHLGEVLWQKGKHDEAIKIWQEALQTYPDNEVLLDTKRRFQSQ